MADLDKIYAHILDQFSDTPNWQKYYKVFSENTDEIRQAIVDWMTQRYLETAEGYWLDVCGVIIGYPRPEGWDETGVFTWDSSTFDERWDQGVWSTGSGAGLGTGVLISDALYRPLLRAKAYASNAGGSIYDIAHVIDLATGLDITVETVAPRRVYVTFNETVTQWQRYHIRRLAPVQADTDLLLTN